jgi:hypothetical protein
MKAYHKYRVVAKLKYPSVYHHSWETYVEARTKAEAIKFAKAEAERESIFSRMDGGKTWQAEIED